MQSDRLDKSITEFPVGHLGTGTHFSGKAVIRPSAGWIALHGDVTVSPARCGRDAQHRRQREKYWRGQEAACRPVPPEQRHE
jgi:hypothetical protein